MANYTLSQIKSHPSFPFIDFEEDQLSFLMLELYWAQFFLEVVGSAVSGWGPLFDAEPDGNPILSVFNSSNGRALRVIQKVNRESKPVFPAASGEGAYYGLQAWLNRGRTLDGATELNELVLFADLSKQAEIEAGILITLHCVELAQEEIVEEAIRAYEERVDMPE